jgi:Catechol dioxygenase N terminus
MSDSKMDASNGIPVQKTNDYHDPKFTDNVIAAMGPKTSPRMREVMTGLVRHLHDFARETNLTVSEWMAGVELVPSLPVSQYLKRKEAETNDKDQ